MSRTASVSRPRALAYVALLSAYPVLPLLLRGIRSPRALRLPSTALGLIDLTILELTVFAAWLSVGWLLARPTCDQLSARLRGGRRSIALGLLEGLGLWISVPVLIGGVIRSAASLLHLSATTLEALRPHTERIVQADVLRNNPAYLLAATSLVSFGLAGLREELWRSALLHGLRALWPRSAQSPAATWTILCGTASLFGLGHWTQGPGGVLLTTALGAAFGLILLGHRSLWEAVVAHGVFDALSFVALAVGPAPS